MGDSKNWSNFAAKQTLTMEQKFGKNSIDIKALREFCEREGKEVTYRKGDQLEREGDPARWFGFVTEGCFKYVTYGISDDREHITWFSFEGEIVADYPNCLDSRPAQTTIEAMVPTRVLRVSGEQLMDFFRQDAEKTELRSICAEHVLRQRNQCYIDLHRATARERYELLLQRCPGIVEHLALQDLASFLCITPQMLSKIRNSQRNLFRSTKIAFLQKFTETSFRVSPPASDFRSCQGLFRGTFCNFVARNDKIIVK